MEFGVKAEDVIRNFMWLNECTTMEGWSTEHMTEEEYSIWYDKTSKKIDEAMSKSTKGGS